MVGHILKSKVTYIKYIVKVVLASQNSVTPLTPLLARAPVVNTCTWCVSRGGGEREGVIGVFRGLAEMQIRSGGERDVKAEA